MQSCRVAIALAIASVGVMGFAKVSRAQAAPQMPATNEQVAGGQFAGGQGAGGQGAGGQGAGGQGAAGQAAGGQGGNGMQPGGMPVGGNGNGSSSAGFNPASRYSQSDYPAAEVQTVPIARARAANARAEQDMMLADLHATVDHLREDFNYSEPMVAALREENSAFLAYDDARRKVLESVSSDPTYRAMISLVVTLKNKLEEERPTNPKPSAADLERLMATATLKLSYASAASAMESAALATDERVQETRSRLVTAGQKTSALRTDFDRTVRRSAEFLQARRNLDDARIAHITAEAFLDGAIDARDYALNYAYYIHRFDQYSYSPALLGSGLYYGAGNGFYGR